MVALKVTVLSSPIFSKIHSRFFDTSGMIFFRFLSFTGSQTELAGFTESVRVVTSSFSDLVALIFRELDSSLLNNMLSSQSQQY
jgi:hypothetical protein